MSSAGAVDQVVLALLAAGLVAMYLPSYIDLARLIWPQDEQGHGPFVLAVSVWLLYASRRELARAAGPPAPVGGALVLGSGLLLYVAGRSQDILMFEVGSQIAVLAGLILLFLGRHALAVVWFPLGFLVFMVPLPDALVASLTGPLKAGVSSVAAALLHTMGYPVGRAGVMLSVGPYRLLVVDACAGLNSMFTLWALGLLYLRLVGHASAARNALLALLVIPIAFFANVVRVLLLALVTYHLGDNAGQSFLHGFAGMAMFMVGLLLVLATDALLGVVFGRDRGRA